MPNRTTLASPSGWQYIEAVPDSKRALQWGAALVLLGCLALLLVKTSAWPLISDAVLMHYVVLLMHHGMLPYRDIVDVNMPGSYLADMAVIRVFGTGAFGWRLFDYTLTAIAGIAMLDMLRTRSLFAGLLGAALFAILHIGDGVAQAAQRDYLIAILLLAGCALLVRGVRTGASWQFFVFGLCCGVSATIKPPTIAFALLLAAAGYAGPSRTTWPGRLAAGLAGVLMPLAAACAWLVHLHSLRAFLLLTQSLVVYHAGMARHPIGFLIAHAIPSQLLPLALLALAIQACDHGWRHIEQNLALLAIACGLLSFCIQGKAYPYHRYPLLAFFWLFVAMQVAEALSSSRSSSDRCSSFKPALGWTIVAYSLLWLAPASTAKALRYNWRYQPTLVQLQADLTAAGPFASLNGQVQCMDTMAGCITVLDRMQLVQATGFLYDCYFLAPEPSPVKQTMQQQFLAQIRRAPPAIFVVTDQWCLNLPSGYRKLDQWPEFAGYLAAHYTLTQQRAWTGWNPRVTATYPFGYRIYTRN